MEIGRKMLVDENVTSPPVTMSVDNFAYFCAANRRTSRAVHNRPTIGGLVETIQLFHSDHLSCIFIVRSEYSDTMGPGIRIV